MVYDGSRQFLDRHPAYSARVQKAVERLAANLEKLHGTAKTPASCKKCEADRKENEKLPPPKRLLGVLNRLSGRLRGFLVGKPERDSSFTSSWCDARLRKSKPEK